MTLASDDHSFGGRQRLTTSTRRCFVVDPVCAFNFGHSLNALNYFTQLAQSRWDHVMPVASYHLAPSTDHDDAIDRFFDFYYGKFINLSRRDIKYNGFAVSAPSDPRKRAFVDYSNFFFYKGIGPADSVVMPNADLYSLLSLCTILAGIAVEAAPKIYLRFIGVMEHAAYSERDHIGIVVAQIRELKARGYRIAVSAETPTLSRSMMRLLDSQVYTTPYPLVGGEVMPLPDGTFSVLCGGSARIDKGFARLPSIIKLVNEATDGGCRFYIQSAPPTEQIHHLSTITELLKTKNVTMLEGILPYSDILAAYAATSLSIMPYDPEVYAERGSAILMESIMFGRLVVGQADTAFSEQILLYNSGETARSNEEFAKAIIRLSTLPRRYIEQQAAAARQRYVSDIRESYAGWLGDQI